MAKYSCRACFSTSLCELLDMGQMPLAGDFRPPNEASELYPLAIDLCASCGLLQVRELVPHAILFNSHYCYASSTVPDLVRHFREFARDVRPAPGVPKRLLEVGCNDGIFLEPLREVGYDVVGIDASDNVAQLARNKGLRVYTGTFGPDEAKRIVSESGRFDVITCSNVFAHNPDLDGFLRAIQWALAPDGEFWVEVHSAANLFFGLQWDCFYHEHCFYWTIHSLSRFLARFGFRLSAYRTTGMHGGALRATFSQDISGVIPQEPELQVSDWTDFGAKCIESRGRIRDTMNRLGCSYAYGAAGRAVTLINWAGIGEMLQFVVDGSPLRVGRAIPNTLVPIISEDAFRQRASIDRWCFVSAHNYVDSIAQKVQAWFPQINFRFITPLPYVTIR